MQALPSNALAVIVRYAYRNGEHEPRIERLDDWTVRVDGDTISFNPATAPQHGATVTVDVSAVR